jgi:DNA-binding transcriptional LysR family regulator
MELRHLRYFIAVAEELHFARAAERLNITPPSLTQQVQSLEAELGVRLLNRTKRSVELTDAGRRFLEEARKTIRQAEHTELVGRQAGRGDLGRIEIGYMTSSACSGVVSRCIADYHRQHQLVDLRLHKLETPHQLGALAERRIDAGFVRPPDRYPLGLTGIVVFRQPVVIALPESHPLARAKRLECADLANEPFIAPSVEAELAYAGYVAAIAEQGGFTPRITGRATDYLTVVTMVSAGIGLAAVPSSFTRVQIPGVRYRDVNLHKEARIALSYRRDERSPAVKSFIACVKATVSKMDELS